MIDIGKTLSKVSLWADDGECLAKVTRENQPQLAGAYTALDTVATGEWLIDTLARFAGHRVTSIIPIAHGAAVVGIRGDELSVVPPDYEWQMPTDLRASYVAQRDPFAETGSPLLPAGLNMGSQIHALEAIVPDAFRGTILMPYAQYWAWLLSGVAVSEVTSLGCHSDLWAPATAAFSSMARRRGWAGRFAPLARAGDAVGTLRPEIAARTGLSTDVRIFAGLHDSNAALLASRSFAEFSEREATVLSTGTWFVAMRSPGEPVDLADLPADRDCLINVDVSGHPVPSARFMGGREIELLGERIDRPGLEGLDNVLRDWAMALPSQVPGCGPFPHGGGGWRNRPDDPVERAASIALYAALMTDASLSLIGARERLLIEGRFAASELFARALATLRPDMAVHAAATEADVAFGALRLVWPQLGPANQPVRVQPLAVDLRAYVAQWRSFADAGDPL